MFATIRKHQTWLFAVIIGIVIVSFVIFFTPGVENFGQSGRSASYSIYGKQVPPDRFEEARREVALFFYMNYGEWPGSGRVSQQLEFDVDQQALQRLVMLRKLEEAGILVADDAVVAWIRRIFTGENGAYDPEQYRLFVERVLGQVRFSEKDFLRFVRHQVAMAQLQAAHGLSGRLVPPAMVKSQLERDFQRLDTEVALFAVSNYLAKVQVDTNKVAEYYTNNMAAYRTQPQRQISYVSFAASNHLNEAKTLLNEDAELAARIEAEYADRGTNSFRGKDGEVMAPDDARIRLMSLRLSRGAANEFANELFDEVIDKPERSEADFLAFAEKKGREAHTTAPFEQFSDPEELEGVNEIGREAFQLSMTNQISFKVLQGDEASYVIALNKIIPSRVQDYEEIEEQVVEDWKRQEASSLMLAAGREFHKTLTNALAGGTAFQSVCESNQVAYLDVPPFSGRDRSLPEVSKHINFETFQRFAFNTKPGEVSGFRNLGDSGFIIHAVEELPAEESRVEEELAETIETARSRGENQAFAAWFNQQIQLAGPSSTVGSP